MWHFVPMFNQATQLTALIPNNGLVQAGNVATALQIGHKGEILFDRYEIEILRLARVGDKPDIGQLRCAAVFADVLCLLAMVIAIPVYALSRRIAE